MDHILSTFEPNRLASSTPQLMLSSSVSNVLVCLSIYILNITSIFCASTLMSFLVLVRLKATIQLKGLENIPCLSQWYCRRGRKEPGPSTPATPQYLPMFVMVSSQPNSQQEVSSMRSTFESSLIFE